METTVKGQEITSHLYHTRSLGDLKQATNAEIQFNTWAMTLIQLAGLL